MMTKTKLKRMMKMTRNEKPWFSRVLLNPPYCALITRAGWHKTKRWLQNQIDLNCKIRLP